MADLIEYMSHKLSKYNKENDSFEFQINELRSELQYKEATINKHRDDMLQYNDHINNLTRRLTEMSVDIAPYRVKYSSCMRAIEPLEESVIRKTKAIERLEDKLYEERKRVKKLTEQISQMQTNLVKCLKNQQGFIVSNHSSEQNDSNEAQSMVYKLASKSGKKSQLKKRC